MHSTVTVTFSLFPMRLIYPFGEDLEAATKVKLLVITRGFDQAFKSQLYLPPQTMPSAPSTKLGSYGSGRTSYLERLML